MSDVFRAIVLAAGKGSRMKSDLPKVLIPLCGKPVISYITDALIELGIADIVIVIGSSGNMVAEVLGDRFIYVSQDDQLGSGHAVMCAKDSIPADGHLLIMCGDSPLFRSDTISSLMRHHIDTGAVVTLVAAELSNPSGYGRILRDGSGKIIGVAEEKNADENQKLIREINGGCYAFDAGWLWHNIESLALNSAGEYCLTEMADIAASQNSLIESVSALPYEVAGINMIEQLRDAEKIIAASEISDF